MGGGEERGGGHASFGGRGEAGLRGPTAGNCSKHARRRKHEGELLCGPGGAASAVVALLPIKPPGSVVVYGSNGGGALRWIGSRGFAAP